MTDAIETAIFVAAAACVVTALTTLWLCFKARRVSDALVESQQTTREERAVVQKVVLDALTRIEAAANALKIATAKLAESVQAGNDTGLRIESAAGDVAHDLADSIGRADAMPKDGNFGAAADAALRSAHDEE